MEDFLRHFCFRGNLLYSLLATLNVLLNSYGANRKSIGSEIRIGKF